MEGRTHNRQSSPNKSFFLAEEMSGNTNQTIHLVVTDPEWFFNLKDQNAEEVNFWSPGGTLFKAQPNDLFLFKLKSPHNCIAGGGYFQRSLPLPLSLAWQTFDRMNGRDSYDDFRKVILGYQKDRQGPDPRIGCTLLSSCFFWSIEQSIRTPATFSSNIVREKKYSLSDQDGVELLREVEKHLRFFKPKSLEGLLSPLELVERFGKPGLIRQRLGQRGFRFEILAGYGERCAMTGERTLPVLQAAHIKPYSEGGPHSMGNGLLLRSDLHTLFDAGYIAVTNDYHIEVSRKIREEYKNGREYYALQGRPLILPTNEEYFPNQEFLQWHQEHRYVG